jgi:hypothetical protein
LKDTMPIYIWTCGYGYVYVHFSQLAKCADV